jgi:hypothetical protein
MTSEFPKSSSGVVRATGVNNGIGAAIKLLQVGGGR